MTLDARLRAHILAEQLVVPFVRGAFDLVTWNEQSGPAGAGKDKIRGAKFGMHYGLGAALLLDSPATKRASLLEAQSGINDTFITFDWRRQDVDARELPWAPSVHEGLTFSGSVFTIGLKLDY